MLKQSILTKTEKKLLRPFVNRCRRYWKAERPYNPVLILTGNELFGIATYFLIPGPILGKIVTSQHLFTLPLSIFALYLIKIKRKDAWKFSFVELAIVFFVTILITSEKYNINCVYNNCLNFNVGVGTTL